MLLRLIAGYPVQHVQQHFLHLILYCLLKYQIINKGISIASAIHNAENGVENSNLCSGAKIITIILGQYDPTLTTK